MNGSSLTPKMAGIESSANSRSVLPIASRTRNSGVSTRLPSTRVIRLARVVAVGERQPAPRGGDEDVVLHRRVLLAVAEELHRRGDQEQPEHEEHERERRQQRGAERDEDRAQDEREQDPDGEHLVLVLGGHRERAHDDHEHEQVVDRQALLDDVAGEVLAAELPAGDDAEHDAEDRARPRCRTPTGRRPRGSRPRAGGDPRRRGRGRTGRRSGRASPPSPRT